MSDPTPPDTRELGFDIPAFSMQLPEPGVVKLAPVTDITGSNGNKKLKKPPIGVEMGVPQSMPFGTFTDWITGQLLAPNNQLVPLENLVEMRRKDGTARAMLQLLRLPILRSLKDSEFIEPEEGGEQETEFMNQVFSLPPSSGGMTVSRSKFIRNALLALSEGFAVFEKVYDIPKQGPLEGKVTYRKLAHRDARTIRFIIDDHGGFDGVKQTANYKGSLKDIVIPKEKVWFYAVNEEENPFYGVSMFEAAWHHWDIKRKLYYIWHIAAQVAAVAARMGTYPRSADPTEIAAFQTMLSNFGFNASGTHPKDFEVQFANVSGTFNFEALVNHQNAQMAKSVLVKFLEDEARQVLIENGQTDTADADFFVMTEEALMDEIAESIDHYLVPDLVDYNFGSGKYPKFKFGLLNDATKDVIKDLFTAIATAQDSMWTDEFIREMEKKLTERLGLEVDYEAVEQREAEEAERQSMLEQAYFQQQGGGPGAQDEEQGGGPPGQQPTGPPAVAAAAGIPIEMARVIDKVERLMLTRREADLDGDG